MSPVAKPATNYWGGLLAAVKVRRAFYSFHYRDVLRVNHVRNSGKIRPVDKERFKTPQDRSLWERSRRTDPSALRRMIDKGLEQTSVTCVLAGYATWSREWVRYEIARSLFRGNGVLTVHIHNCKCPNDGFGYQGYNPLAHMALGWDSRIYEFVNGGWYPYPKIAQTIPAWPKWLQKPPRDHVMPLATGARCYDWKEHDGFNNLVHWTDAAAIAAGH